MNATVQPLYKNNRRSSIIFFLSSWICKWYKLCISNPPGDRKRNCFSEASFPATMLILLISEWMSEKFHISNTFGRESKYMLGTSISSKVWALIAIAALRIWLVASRWLWRCFFEFSERPLGGTFGVGSHHFSSCRCMECLTPLLSISATAIPRSTYQKSVSW